jgi:hypothetical protein
MQVLPRVMHSQFGRFHAFKYMEAQTFFAGLTAKRQRKAVVPSRNPCVTEVDNYLEDPSSELSSLFKYPNILKLYVKLNTGLPASAAVERLFSLGGRVFTLIRANMISEHFEVLVFLRAFESGL